MQLVLIVGAFVVATIALVGFVAYVVDTGAERVEASATQTESQLEAPPARASSPTV